MMRCFHCGKPFYGKECAVYYNHQPVHPSCFHKIKTAEFIGTNEVRRIQLGARLVLREYNALMKELTS